MSKKHQVIFKNSKSSEFAMGFRTKFTKEVAMIDFVYFDDIKSSDGNIDVREHYVLSSIALTKDTASDLIKKLQMFVNSDE